MVARKKNKYPIAEETAPGPLRDLKAYFHGQPKDLVSSARFYWLKGTAARETIMPYFLAKRRPAGADSPIDTAAKIEMLLRKDVPENYTDPQFVAEDYMAKLPIEETSAFAQITMRFPEASNLHGPWERARSWLREHYVERLGVPVLAIMHAPFLAGSDASIHVHGLVLTRKLTAFGWFGTSRDLAGDSALADAQASWAQQR